MKITRAKAAEYLTQFRSLMPPDKELLEASLKDDLEFKQYLDSEASAALIGVTNEFIAAWFSLISGDVVEIDGDVEEMHKCPCCGFLTLTEPSENSSYEICRFCNWQNDGTTDQTIYKGINKGSMLDYRSRRMGFPNQFIKG